jgi:hypothetical protein
MKHTVTVYTLASDDDYGTKAEVFADEREAVRTLVIRLKYIAEGGDGIVEKLIETYFDPDGDFYEDIAEYKTDYDTYSVDSHTLEIEV